MWIAMIIIIICLSACQSSDNSNKAPNSDSRGGSQAAMKISVGSYHKDSGCPNDTVPCARIDLRYFKAEGGPAGVADSVNMRVRNLLLDVLNGAVIDTTLLVHNKAAKKDIGEAAKVLVKDYEKMKAEAEADTPLSTLAYEIMCDTMFIEVLPKFIALGMSNSTYTGGAHPYGFVSLINLNHQTGELITPNDFVKDKKALLAVAEAKFRQNRQLKPNENLTDAGYFLGEDNAFFLPGNMALRSNGLQLLYNPYEIASYAEGIIDFTIPYEQLGNAIQTDW